MGSGAAVGAGVGAMIGSGPGAIVGGIVGALTGLFGTPDTVRVLLSEDGKDWLVTNRGDDFFPYEIVGGDTEQGIGLDGLLYLKTKGMVQIFVACDKCNALENGGTSVDSVECERCEDNKVKYFKSEILEEMYQVEYLDQLAAGNENYAQGVLNYLKKAYCYGAERNPETVQGEEYLTQKDCITIYSERKENDEGAQLEYINESEEASEPFNLWETIKGWFGAGKDNKIIRDIVKYEESPNTLQNIFYSNIVSQYATPVELMINLLEITGSKDFVNSFIETVGDGNYVKVKLYTTRNKEVRFVSEQWDRNTEVEAKRDLMFTAEIIGKKDDHWLIDSSWQTGEDELKEVKKETKVKVTQKPDKSKITVKITGGNDNSLYRIKIKMNGNDFQTIELGKETFLFFGGSDWSTDIIISPDWIKTFEGDSDVIRTREITNITDKFYPAVSEVKTWYGSYKATNTVERSYELTQVVGKEQYKNEMTNGSNGTYEKVIETDYSKIVDLNNRDDFQAKELYERLIEDVDVELYPVYYDSVSKHDNNWISKIEADKKVTEIINYNDTINISGNSTAAGGIIWVPTGGPFTEDELRKIQMNYVMQSEAENSMSYNDLINNLYEVTSMTQEDKNLFVIDVKMDYRESISEGLTNGNVTTSDKEIFTFLGLLSNKYDSSDPGSEPDGVYHLGETFVPESSGGRLVSYGDLYNGESRVGKLLENGEDMLCTLLEESERTQGLVQVMRYAMYLFRNNNYVVSNWIFNIFTQENMLPVS